jgi:hypothetical protein
MATLAGNTIASTYPLLLKIDSSGIDGTLRAVQDGDATDSALSIATDSVLVKGSGIRLYFHDADGGEHIAGDGTDLTITSGADIILAGTAVNITADTIDLSDATKDVTLNAAVDALNFDSNTLSIDASNNRVGIGTAAPTNPLEVAVGAADESVRLSCYSTTDAHHGALLFTKSGNATIGTAAATAAGETLGAIVAQGHHTGNAVKAAASIKFQGDAAPDGDSVPGRIIFSTSDADDAGSPTERMRIADDGNIGIGNTAPSAKLMVDDNTDAGYSVKIRQDHATGYGLYVETEGTTTGDSALNVKSNDGANQLLWVDNDGKIGINTASPTAKLHVKQDSAVHAMLIDQNANDYALEISGNGVTSGTVFEVGSNTIVGGTLAHFYSSHDDNTVRNLVKITNDDNAADNAVCLYIQQDGADASIELAGNGGIKFPGTQGASADVNTLDDYEEGIHTTAITGADTAGDFVLDSSNQSLAYTKIGRMVTVQGKFQTSSGSGAGHLKISMPFTSNNVLDDSADISVGSITMNRTGSTSPSTQMTPVIFSNTAFVNIQLHNEGNANETYLQADDVDGTFEGQICISYIV